MLEERIKAKALELVPVIKQHGPKVAIFAPVVLVPLFFAIVLTTPNPRKIATKMGEWGHEVVVPLPPVSGKVVEQDTNNPTIPVTQVETKIVYVQVPAKDGKPATVKAVEVPVAAPPAPVQQPEPAPVPVPEKTIIDEIFEQPRPQPAPVKAPPRKVLVTSVSYDPRMSNFQPDYPENLRNDGVQGTVKVRVTVGPNGRPRSIVPIGNPNPKLFNVVKNHGMRNWKFRPATVDGMPSTGNIDISLAFKIAGE